MCAFLEFFYMAIYFDFVHEIMKSYKRDKFYSQIIREPIDGAQTS